MLEGKEVTWFPSYGAEVRGGTANCTVIVSDELIGSPVVLNPDTLIVMNEASMYKFLPRLKEKGIFIFDSSLIKNTVEKNDIKILGVPATEISSKINTTKSANMVLLGAFIAVTGLLDESYVLEAIEKSMSGKNKKIIEDNKKALIKGIRYIEDKKS